MIHGVGPRWLDGAHGEPAQLAQCYASIFDLVARHNLSSVAIPSIGTGIHHFPHEQAAQIALHAAKTFQQEHPHVRVTFVSISQPIYATYQRLYKQGCGLVPPQKQAQAQKKRLS